MNFPYPPYPLPPYLELFSCLRTRDLYSAPALRPKLLVRVLLARIYLALDLAQAGLAGAVGRAGKPKGLRRPSRNVTQIRVLTYPPRHVFIAFQAPSEDEQGQKEYKKVAVFGPLGACRVPTRSTSSQKPRTTHKTGRQKR